MTSVPNAAETSAPASPWRFARPVIRWQLVAGLLLGYVYYVSAVILVTYGLRSAWGVFGR